MCAAFKASSALYVYLFLTTVFAASQKRN